MENFEKYVGTVFDGRYEIEKIIGVGGMAVVFRATDLLMKRTVSLKMLKEEIAADAGAVRRFINESKAVAMLSHPNIVNIYDVSFKTKEKYIVMEYIEGITLKKYINHKKVLSLEEIISFTEQILRALTHAHQKGVIHRDIKPQNIMLLKSGVIKVMDFGIAKLPNADTVTVTDKAIGTVYYISPEQASGKEIDARSDLYSLGVMMYEMATGTLPFDAETPVTVALKQINDAPRPPHEINPQMPKGLEQIITVAMKKDRESRFQSAEQMSAYIAKLKENHNIVFKQAAPTPAGKAKPKKNGKEGSRSFFPIIIAVVSAFVIIAIIAAVLLFRSFFNSGDSAKSQEIEVTQFAGYMLTEELEDWFAASKYYMLEVEYVHSSEYEAGKIIKQEPEAGAKRKVIENTQKCTVKLTVSLGAETSVLKDFTITDAREVKIALEALGITVVQEPETHDSCPEGYVIRTEPAAGTEIKSGDTVTLYVSTGPEEQKVTLPDFTGWTEVETLEYLTENNLQKGTITYERSDAPAGTIIDQSIAEGTEVSKYSTIIDFVVSSSKVYVPELVSLSVDAAKAECERVGLTVKEVIEVFDAEMPAGLVISSTPDANTEITSEITEITLTVSLGPDDGTVKVPNVLGKTESEAKAAIEAAGFTVGTVTPKASNETDGTIISQSTNGGDRAAAGSAIDLEISYGPDAWSIPSGVEGKEYLVIRDQLKALGGIVEIEFVYNDTVRKDTVISVEPGEGTVMHKNDTVKLQVSLGAEPEETDPPATTKAPETTDTPVTTGTPETSSSPETTGTPETSGASPEETGADA